MGKCWVEQCWFNPYIIYVLKKGASTIVFDQKIGPMLTCPRLDLRFSWGLQFIWGAPNATIPKIIMFMSANCKLSIPSHGSFMALGCLHYSTSETDTYDIRIKIRKCYTTCPQFGWNLPTVGKKLSRTRIWWFSEDLLVLWVLTHANHRGERLFISWVIENWIFEGISHISWILENCDTPFQSLHMHVSCKQNHIFCRVDAFAYSSQLYKNWLLVSTTWKTNEPSYQIRGTIKSETTNQFSHLWMDSIALCYRMLIKTSSVDVDFKSTCHLSMGCMPMWWTPFKRWNTHCIPYFQ